MLLARLYQMQVVIIVAISRHWFSLDQGFPKWAMTDTQGATSSKWVRGGGMSSKGTTGGHEVII